MGKKFFAEPCGTHRLVKEKEGVFSRWAAGRKKSQRRGGRRPSRGGKGRKGSVIQGKKNQYYGGRIESRNVSPGRKHNPRG